MSQKDNDNLQNVEKEKIKEQKKQKEEEEKKEENKNEKEKNEIKEKKTFWKQGIVKDQTVTFEDFKFNDNDFAIIKNENEEEVKTVDQIFYRFVQDEIKEIDDFLKNKMDEWNSLKEKDKTYEKFKNVFVVDYERKHLFVTEEEDLENNDININ